MERFDFRFRVSEKSINMRMYYPCNISDKPDDSHMDAKAREEWFTIQYRVYRDAQFMIICYQSKCTGSTKLTRATRLGSRILLLSLAKSCVLSERRTRGSERGRGRQMGSTQGNKIPNWILTSILSHRTSWKFRLYKTLQRERYYTFLEWNFTF